MLFTLKLMSSQINTQTPQAEVKPSITLPQGTTSPQQQMPVPQAAPPSAPSDEVVNVLTELLSTVQRLINAIAKCRCEKKDQCEVFLRAQQIVDKYDKILDVFEKLRPR